MIDPLIAGLFGGLVAAYMFPAKRPEGTPRPRGRRRYCALAASVVVSVSAAVYLGPLTAAWCDIESIPNDAELRAFSFIWGAGAQAGLLMAAIRALKRLIDSIRPRRRKTV